METIITFAVLGGIAWGLFRLKRHFDEKWLRRIIREELDRDVS